MGGLLIGAALVELGAGGGGNLSLQQVLDPPAAQGLLEVVQKDWALLLVCCS